MVIVKRSKPYPPNFNNKLAKITEPIVGASTCASGNQIWNGNIGTLTANGIKKNIHNKICSSESKTKFNNTEYSSAFTNCIQIQNAKQQKKWSK